MILTNLPHEVMILSPVATEDEYGNATVTFDGASSKRVRAFVQAGSTSEVEDDSRSTSIETARAYFAPGVAITNRDRVVFRDETWRVKGAPARRSGLVMTSGPVVVEIERVVG